MQSDTCLIESNTLGGRFRELFWRMGLSSRTDGIGEDMYSRFMWV